MFYITPTLEVLNFLKIKKTDCDNASTDCESTSESMKKLNENHNIKENNKENCTVGKWDRNAILFLIKLFKENYNNFKSTSMKNEHVWIQITKKMNERSFTHTKIQIENKFKYLKH